MRKIILFLATIVLSLQSFATNNDRSRVRIFEVNYMYPDSVGNFSRPICMEKGCRYIEIETLNESILNVKNCAINEPLVRFYKTNEIYSGIDEKSDRTFDNELPRASPQFG